MKVFYRSEQSAKKNSSFSPSAGKPALVVKAWEKLYPAIHITTFEPTTRAQLYQVHDRKYVDRVLDCKQNNGFGNKLKEVAHALPFVAGSMVAATINALTTGETSFSLTSGAHHACYDHGGGYCTFNFLVLAAVEAHKAGAKRVGIVDVDNHAGNGTVDIIKKLKIGYINHYSFGYDTTKPHRQPFTSGFSSWADAEVGMIETRTAEQWLKVFTLQVQDIMRDCDVVLFNAGVDCHQDDPLGGVLSTEEMAERDEIVFKAAKQAGTPVAVSLAGGYQEPISKVIALHTNTYEAARRNE